MSNSVYIAFESGIPTLDFVPMAIPALSHSFLRKNSTVNLDGWRTLRDWRLFPQPIAASQLLAPLPHLAMAGGRMSKFEGECSRCERHLYGHAVEIISCLLAQLGSGWVVIEVPSSRRDKSKATQENRQLHVSKRNTC